MAKFRQTRQRFSRMCRLVFAGSSPAVLALLSLICYNLSMETTEKTLVEIVIAYTSLGFQMLSKNRADLAAYFFSKAYEFAEKAKSVQKQKV